MEEEKIVLLLVTGCSGAGKTTVASVAESLGYYITESIPAAMIDSLLAVFKSDPQTYGKVALFVPIDNFQKVRERIVKDKEIALKSWGLDCSFDVLMARFRLTRHIHPRQPRGMTLDEAIQQDRQIMDAIRDNFDIYIDTTSLSEKELRIKARALIETDGASLSVFFSSFGFKYGLPRDSEMVIDARFLPNPYWDDELAKMTGLDAPVIEYIEKSPITKDFMKSLYNLLDLYFSESAKLGRGFVTVNVGCTGGQHRSVYIVEQLYKHYRDLYDCTLSHRELSRYVEVQ